MLVQRNACMLRAVALASSARARRRTASSRRCTRCCRRSMSSSGRARAKSLRCALSSSRAHGGAVCCLFSRMLPSWCSVSDSSAHGAATGARARRVHPWITSVVRHQCQVPVIGAVAGSAYPAGAEHQAPRGVWHDARNRLGRHPGLGGGRVLLEMPGRAGRRREPVPEGPALCAPARECAPSCEFVPSGGVRTICALGRCWEVHAPGEAEAGLSAARAWGRRGHAMQDITGLPTCC